MVADWLKLELLQQFFGLLAEDGANDKRRLRFWERYIESIDDMYFALGGYAGTNRSRDFVELRKKMSGRVLDLHAGGTARNNAFIMRMGNYVVVEFGVRGNACFIFEHRYLPFDLNRPAVAGDKTALKHDSHVERLRHVDSTAGYWEQQFERTLRRLVHVQPTAKGKRIDHSTSALGAQRQKITATNPRADQASNSRTELERFAATRGLNIRDFTGQRGNLWVLTDQSDESVNSQLLEWGFRYKPSKGWWRET
jgi:hypothetical protein